MQPKSLSVSANELQKQPMARYKKAPLQGLSVSLGICYPLDKLLPVAMAGSQVASEAS